MANSNRRYTDKSGNTFIPMNVEGGSWNENFITTPKLITLGLSLVSIVMIIGWLNGQYASIKAYVVFIGLWTVAFIYIMRYIIFEERFYYKMYKNLKLFEISNPSLFWDIASVKETVDGAVLTYNDGKIGVIVKLERDTITGKNSDFKEEHYDAISDFYKDITSRRYSFIQMNIMEQAGNDPRLVELDKLTFKDENPNICKLMEKQVGYIKNITHKTLYESDYILIYTKDLTRIDYIVNDTVEAISKIMDGAFIGHRIINSRDIIEFIKEEYGVKYFNYTEATLAMFKNNGVLTKKPFDIKEVVFSTGEVQEIGDKELNVINNIASGVSNGTINIDKVSIKEALITKKEKEKFNGLDFSKLSEGFDTLDSKEEFTIIDENDNSNILSEFDLSLEGEFKFGEFDIHSDDTMIDFEDSNSEKIQQKNEEETDSVKVFEDDDEYIDI